MSERAGLRASLAETEAELAALRAGIESLAWYYSKGNGETMTNADCFVSDLRALLLLTAAGLLWATSPFDDDAPVVTKEAKSRGNETPEGRLLRCSDCGDTQAFHPHSERCIVPHCRCAQFVATPVVTTTEARDE